MRIGFCTWRNPYNKSSWSGTLYSMFYALTKYCGDVIPLGPLNSSLMFLGKGILKLGRGVWKKNFLVEHSLLVSRELGFLLERKLEKEKFDILFFPGNSELLANLHTKTKVVYFSDATFHAMVDYYPAWTNLYRVSMFWGEEIERKAIARSDAIVYASHWAAQSAVSNYDCQCEKIHIIKCGGNALNVPPKDFLFRKRETQGSRLQLFFTGSNWERKGGEIAFQTMIELNKRNLDATLIVCGCRPPKQCRHSKLVVIGYLNPNHGESQERYYKLFENASMLLLPSRHECFGYAHCEAAAYCLPVIGTDTGGVSDYVLNGYNGFLLSPAAKAVDYADLIQKVWFDRNLYLKLVRNSNELFHKELNWGIWAQKMKEVFETTAKTTTN